jgi:hypothetical protein
MLMTIDSINSVIVVMFLRRFQQKKKLKKKKSILENFDSFANLDGQKNKRKTRRRRKKKGEYGASVAFKIGYAWRYTCRQVEFGSTIRKELVQRKQCEHTTRQL